MLNVVIWSLMLKTIWSVLIGRCSYLLFELIFETGYSVVNHFKYLGINFVSGVDLECV